jgi:hypothetical protein
MSGRNVPPITPQGVAVWGTSTQNAAGSTNTAAAVGAGTNSSIIDTKNSPFVSAFGHASGATTISILYSADSVNFYAAHSVVLAGGADFCIDCICGAQYVCLQSSGAVNIWATISAKGGGG